MLRALRASRGLPALVGVIGALLRLLALDVDSRHSQGIHFLFYLLAAMSIALYMYTYHVSMYWFILTRAGRSDRILCIVLFALAIGSLIATVKLLYLYFNSEKLRKLVSEYLACDAAVPPDGRMSRGVRPTLLRVRRRAAAFWLLIVGNGVVYVLQPLLLPGKHLLDDRQILFGLEPMFKSPNYEIAFVIEAVSVLLTVYAAANITALIIIIVGYSEAQMLALSQELLNLWEDAQRHYQKIIQNTEGTSIEAQSIQDVNLGYRTFTASVRSRISEEETVINGYVKHRLVTIMKMHAVNIDLVKQVECIFQNAIAIEFGLLSAALIADLLGGLEKTYMNVPFALVQVSMDCITGQKLIDANNVFEAAVYACRWENFDTGNKKLVLMMLQNSQKTMKLSAGGIASLSYSSLMSVVRAIYSAYTALRSTMST